MRAIAWATIAALLTVLPRSSMSHDAFGFGGSIDHSCRKPSKPFNDDEYAWQTFADEVRRYKRCIQDFVDEQNEAAKRHAQAAEEAIEQWNRFVRVELN